MSGKQIEVAYGGSSVISSERSKDDYREYTFSISIDGEHLRAFALRFHSALEVHKVSPRELSSTIKFPNRKTDHARDMTHNDTNAERRGQELLEYYRAVFQRQDVIASDAFRRCIEGSALKGLDLATLQATYCRSYTKVAADPELVRRAMLYLRITGKVLCHDYEHVRFDTVSAAQSSDLRDRVFLRPQWLVDVMKEFVHHNLAAQVEEIDPSVVSDAVEVQRLGRDFASRGVLDKRLLPWLWRNLEPQVVDDEDQIAFLVSLLEQLGLLTRQPRSDPPQWLLPLRLSEKRLSEISLVEFGGGSEGDEVGRVHDFHQPIPSGFVAVVLSRCAVLCGTETEIWRQALSTTLAGEDDTQMQVIVCQDGMSRIVFKARCDAGKHHPLLFEQLQHFEETLQNVIKEKWPGCTATVICTTASCLDGVPLTACQQALARGEHAVRVGDDTVPLSQLLADTAPQLEAHLWAQLASLRFIRDLGAALEGLRDIPAVGKLTAALDARLQSEVGDKWSAALEHADCGLLSLDALQSTEARGLADGQSRTVTLMLTLGRLYEQSHGLSSSSLDSLSGVCEHLLQPFLWLEAALLDLIGKHKLSLPKITRVLKDRDIGKAATSTETDPQRLERVIVLHQMIEADDLSGVKSADPLLFVEPLCSEHRITALHRAVRQGSPAMVHAVLEKLNSLRSEPKQLALDAATGLFSRTAFMLACEGGAPEIAVQLVEAGCDMTKLDNIQRTGLEIAAQSGHAAEICEQLGQLQASGRLAAMPRTRSDGLVRLRSVLDRVLERPDVLERRPERISIPFQRITVWAIRPYSNWRFLAEGGFGKIFLVEDVDLDLISNGQQIKRVVIKAAKVNAAGELKRETEELAKLDRETQAI